MGVNAVGPVTRSMEGQVHLERQMDVHRTSEE